MMNIVSPVISSYGDMTGGTKVVNGELAYFVNIRDQFVTGGDFHGDRAFCLAHTIYVCGKLFQNAQSLELKIMERKLEYQLLSQFQREGEDLIKTLSQRSVGDDHNIVAAFQQSSDDRQNVR